MWPFGSNKRSNNEGDDEWVTKSIPVTTLARWYLYDVDVNNPNKLAMLLDLTPVSEEGDEKERQDSDVRVDRLTNMFPFIKTMAEINAKAVFQVQRTELPQELSKFLDINSPEMEQLVRFYESISFAAIMSALSSAAELGLVELSGKFTSKEIGEEYE